MSLWVCRFVFCVFVCEFVGLCVCGFVGWLVFAFVVLWVCVCLFVCVCVYVCVCVFFKCLFVSL